jgi:regulator of nucleoside diphosphate kinase
MHITPNFLTASLGARIAITRILLSTVLIVLKPIRKAFAMKHRKIIITDEDYRRLETLLGSNSARLISGDDRLAELQGELKRARLMSPADVPDDVVTMNSTVVLRDLDTQDLETYTLVYPNDADIANDKLSVLAPIGTAILGFRIGDELRWRVPAGWRRLKIENVLFQPERQETLNS